ncbi:MAG TPA: NUDIX domain-containing protein [Bacteroidia bacterium]|nr:NUDIX domain-containing protein [Bacteroidia bacterium]HRH07188.1 NUDIX domain-containing protein [Bacteroidia bacterium]
MVALTSNNLTVRVYGLLIKNNAVLVSDEFRMGMFMTKFPGGGMELGEGLHDCLKREWMEELGLEIDIVSHFYTTDYYVKSAFDNRQLLSVYYLVAMKKNEDPITDESEIIKDNLLENFQRFRWIALQHLNPTDFTFEIDKKVASLLVDNVT